MIALASAAVYRVAYRESCVGIEHWVEDFDPDPTKSTSTGRQWKTKQNRGIDQYSAFHRARGVSSFYR
jgi:hypothetical protein